MKDIYTKVLSFFLVAAVIFTLALNVVTYYDIKRINDRTHKTLILMDRAYHEVNERHIEQAFEFAPPGYSIYQLRGFAQTQAQQMLDQLTDHYNLPRYELSAIRFKPLLRDNGAAGTTTGCEKDGTRQTNIVVNLNEILFLRNYDVFMNEIIPHEVAHVIVCLRGGFKQEPGEDFWEAAHGEEWLEAMHVLGYTHAEEMRTHKLDMTPVFEYRTDLLETIEGKVEKLNAKE